MSESSEPQSDPELIGLQQAGPHDWTPPPAEPAEPETPEPAPGFLATVNRRALWTWAVICTLASIGILWVYIPLRRTDVQKKAVRDIGTVDMKDSAPLGDGRVLFTVTIEYKDSKNIVHRCMNHISGGQYDNLNAKQDVRISYVPDQPDIAWIDGADAVVLFNPDGSQGRIVQVAPPGAGALSFVGWNLFIVALVLWPTAWLAHHTPRAGQPKRDKKKPPRVTVTRR